MPSLLTLLCCVQIHHIIIAKAVKRDLLYCATGLNEFVEKEVVTGAWEMPARNLLLSCRSAV